MLTVRPNEQARERQGSQANAEQDKATSLSLKPGEAKAKVIKANKAQTKTKSLTVA
jgi:hypothetical protein